MILYAITIFISAFLLFQVEPIIAKYILPWFGGTPMVWSTVMLFFQVLLLTGYAYAYWLSGRLSSRRQGWIHLVVLVGSLLLLLVTALFWKVPLLPSLKWQPSSVDAPVIDIFKILIVSVGLPYLVLSTNSPLMQRWFSYTHPEESPYWLYSLSNAGSLLALVSYPFIFEPTLSLRMQGWLWSLAYIIFVLLAGYRALSLIRGQVQQGEVVENPLQEEEIGNEQRPGGKQQLLWVALATCPSVLLLATTNKITQDVAAIPFLWILPLAIYLLSFILAFSSRRWYSRRLYMMLFAYSSILLYCINYGLVFTGNLLPQIGVYCIVVFLVCMICHGELAQRKPDPRYLTVYYLMMSIGGVVGGIFVNLVAPVVFNGYWELEIGLVMCWGLLLWTSITRPRLQKYAYLQTVLISIFLSILSFFSFMVSWKTTSDSLFVNRNFYGVLRVREVSQGKLAQPAHLLINGVTSHGFQFINNSMRDLPTAYYTESGGAGLVMIHYRPEGRGRKIGLLGLGIGVMAAYGQPDDNMRFYEINPEVISLAEGEKDLFSYLKDSLANVEIIEGDARISLEREIEESQPQQFDLLFMDTFSSDSIPTHLLTREAFQIYLTHMRPEGVLAVHISNRFLDLRPVLLKQAEYFHMSTALINDTGDGDHSSPSIWMLMSYNRDFLNQPDIASRAVNDEIQLDGYQLWTDDFSNLYQILK